MHFPQHESTVLQTPYWKYCFALQSLRQQRSKTKVRLTTADHTVALGAVALLKDKLHVPMQQLPCLVIGTGEMGRLAVSALQKEGCKVTMTLRNHHSRESVIPANCRVLNYDERIEKINQFRVVTVQRLVPIKP